MSRTIHVNKLNTVTWIFRLLAASAVVLLERDCVASEVLSIKSCFLTVHLMEFCEVSFERSNSWKKSTKNKSMHWLDRTHTEGQRRKSYSSIWALIQEKKNLQFIPQKAIKSKVQWFHYKASSNFSYTNSLCLWKKRIETFRRVEISWHHCTDKKRSSWKEEEQNKRNNKARGRKSQVIIHGRNTGGNVTGSKTVALRINNKDKLVSWQMLHFNDWKNYKWKIRKIIWIWKKSRREFKLNIRETQKFQRNLSKLFLADCFFFLTAKQNR